MTNTKNSSEYSVAIVGLGRIGLQMELDEKRVKPATHFGSYCHNPRISELFLVDSYPAAVEKAKEAVGILDVKKPVKYFYDYQYLYYEKPDIVVVATNPESHYGVVNFVAPFTRSIVCEKPISTSLTDARAMVEICKRENTVLIMDHCRRFLELTWVLGEWRKNGSLGEVRHITGLYTAGIMNSGTHMIDLFRCLNGEISDINYVVASPYSCPDGDINLDAIMTFENGSRGFLQSSEAKNYAIFDINIYGSKSSIFITNFGMKAYLRDSWPCKTFGGYNELADIGDYELIGDSSDISMWGNLASHVIECLDSGCQSSDKSSGEDGVEALRLILDMKFREKNAR